MKERPILFNAEMVRAILDGRKTQTRRIVKPQPAPHLKWAGFIVESWNRLTEGMAQWTDDLICNKEFQNTPCPFGKPGDRLWVRETFSTSDKGWIYKADGHDLSRDLLTRWKPSIHMPRWASRITLEIKSVRVERLQDISEEEALACGFRVKTYESGFTGDAKWHYRQYWESVLKDENKPDWYGNPWVWCIEFERVK